MFLDEARIQVTGGKGGDGCVAWRREKYVAKGGPNGGDGGRGGNIYLIADANADTLSNFASKKVYKAPSGTQGQGSNKAGRSGEDLWLKVPPGTLVYEGEAESETFLADLSADGDQVLLAAGGKGGFGNAHFKSSTRQRPSFAEKGEPGEQKKIRLELKLVADVGIIGYPSVGKSTLISVISAAKPKIAAYEFTTLIPNLGVVHVDDRDYIACDIPGLIEGASDGKGLGHQFLKHIERCGILVHLLDISRALVEGGKPDPEVLIDNYRTIRTELEKYSPTLAEKPELVVVNKIDLISPEQIVHLVDEMVASGIEIFGSISAATTENVEDLKRKLLTIVLREREKRSLDSARDDTAEEGELPVLRPHLQSDKMGAYRVETKDDGAVYVYGNRIEQLTIMTDFMNEEGVRRFRDVCDRVGLTRAIEKERHGEALVYIGEREVSEWLF